MAAKIAIQRDLEGADQGQELADEAAGAGQADIGQGEHHEGQRIERHAVDQPAIGGDLAGVHAVIDHADAEEQRARDHAVADHLEDAAFDALMVPAKMPMVTKPIWATDE